MFSHLAHLDVGRHRSLHLRWWCRGELHVDHREATAGERRAEELSNLCTHLVGLMRRMGPRRRAETTLMSST